MKIRRAYRYKLKTDGQLAALCRLFAGHRRFVYNYFQSLNQYRLDNGWKILRYNDMEAFLSVYLLKSEQYGWLVEAPKAVLQQALRDLDRAYKDAFDKTQPNKRLPTRKKRAFSSTFRFPQIRQKQKDGSYKFNLKVDNRRVWLPRIGWVGFYKSRELHGDIKNVTVSQQAGSWYVSIQTEYEAEIPTHPSDTYVGCDRGVAVPFAFSDGTKAKPLKAFRKSEDKLAALQRKAAVQVKFSNNWQKTQTKIRRLHHKIANQRKDYLHKLSTKTSKNHALLYLEDLRVTHMTQRAKPKPSADGLGYERNGQAGKSGLNKSILDVGWSMFAGFCEYKLAERGGHVAYVPAHNTSRTCPACGHVHADNRHTQARFACRECGYQANADWVAAVNISTRGQRGEVAQKSHDAAPKLYKLGRGLACAPLRGKHAAAAGNSGKARATTALLDGYAT